MCIFTHPLIFYMLVDTTLSSRAKRRISCIYTQTLPEILPPFGRLNDKHTTNIMQKTLLNYKNSIFLLTFVRLNKERE